MRVPGSTRIAARVAAASLALVAVLILGGKDTVHAAQTVTLSVPVTNLFRGSLSATTATTAGAIGDPGTTATGDTFLATDMDQLQVGMVIAVDNELMLVTALTEGGLNPDTITVNRGTAAGFPGNGVVAHSYPPGKTIFRNVNYVPVNISAVANESGGNLTVALDANEFENTGSRVGSAINSSATLMTVDDVGPLYTGRTLLIDSEKMLIADGGDLDSIATYPGWTNNSGATIAVTTDEHLVAGMCSNNTDDDGDGKINDGCPAAGDFGVVAEAGAECDNAIDENSLDTSGTGHEDDDGDSVHDEQYEDGDSGAVNDGCPGVDNIIRVSDQALLQIGWTIKVDNEYMKITATTEAGSQDTITVDRAVNSIMASHSSGAPIFGGPDKVEVQRGYAGTTPASHAFLAPINENVRTLTVNPTAPITDGSHFQIDSEKFSAVTAPDPVTGKMKAIRAILGTSMAAHNSVPAPVTLIDGLGGAGVTIAYPTTHLDYRLMQPGAFLVSTGRLAPATGCYAPIDNTGSVEVVCSTQGEFPLGPTGGPGAVMMVGFNALAYTPAPSSITLTLSGPQAADSSGDAYNAQVTASATVKIYQCPDLDTPTPLNYTVNATDIALVRSKFGQPASTYPTYDIDMSGNNINATDIALVRSQFGTRCYHP